MAEYKLSYTAQDIDERLRKVDEINSLRNLVGIKSVKEQINEAISNENLEKYALKTELPIIPENISVFNNDSNYQTKTQLDAAIKGLANTVDAELDKIQEDLSELGEVRNGILELEAVLYDGSVIKFNILGQEVSL